MPSSLILLHHILIRYQSLFTMYRSLPTIDFSLHALSATLFEQSDYAPHQHDAPLKAYEEMSRLYPVAKTSLDALRSKVDGHKRELGLLRGRSASSYRARFRPADAISRFVPGIHPSGSSVPPPSSSTPATVALSEPFQAFLSYSADLGPTANPQTVLDFGSWDQTDLLFSLGLVGNPNESMNGWGLPSTGMREPSDELPIPPLIEANFQGLEGGLPYSSGAAAAGSGEGGGGDTSNMSLDQSLMNLASSSFEADAAGPGFRQPAHGHAPPRFDASMFGQAPPEVANALSQAQYQPHASHPQLPSTSTQGAPSYPSAQFFMGPTSTGPAMEAARNDLAAAGSEERSTDLLTRWLSRGSISLEGFDHSASTFENMDTKGQAVGGETE